MQQMWVPEGFAHGFLTLSAVAEVQYKARGASGTRPANAPSVWDDRNDLAIFSGRLDQLAGR